SKDEIEKRKRVAAFIKREEKIGIDQKKATSEFIKEASYTWINRLLGLKCMECRGLIDEVITTRPEYGGRSKRHRDFREKNPDRAAEADDGLTACLFSAFEEVTEEIKVLFDPRNEYSLVIPRYPTLKKAIEKINTELDYNTYREDEFLGWVYQYFNSREKDRVFEEVRTKKKKISGSDIINVTQLYTEKYMVRFLVENSLGAMWMEMHPDSQLCSKWEYFVKDPNNSRREPKPVKEIMFLDPAGGSGHFLLYAFDLFYDMYLEEGIIPDDQIPEFILRCNLHGIDIDLRAIQLSALGLYMKAKSKNPDMKVQHMNLVSADAIMLDSDILEEFLQEFKDDKTAQELIKTIWKGLENVRELGSLLKVEEQIDEVIKRQKDKRLDFFGEETGKGWEQWKLDLLAALKRYYEKAAQIFDINKQMFASEACKGVQLLDLLEQRYDVVATNPPYMYTRNMGEKLKGNLKFSYPKNNTDLYSAFIERCLQFTSEKGFTSMITQQSFMFITTYKELRKKILSHYQIRTMAHLGPHAFEDIGGEKVNTTMFSFIRNESKSKNATFLRLTQEVEKEIKLKNIIKAKTPNLFILNQDDLKIIEEWPFVYWIGDTIYTVFKSNSPFIKFAEPKAGLATGNNDLFLRYIWEVNSEQIGKKWIPYMKGGEFNKYYGNQEYVVLWENNGAQIKNYPNSVIRNPEYHFKEGITFTDLGAKGFNARYFQKVCLYD
ncbi:MAG: BREX-1 system adenine-specific DNA-methyltransferase PglX, partial [Euryarchaeota archaeon]|nr:BREX-1 system adenine-specific DNA-methyltransferase PglX [Euryarchaeota archaeon]